MNLVIDVDTNRESVWKLKPRSSNMGLMGWDFFNNILKSPLSLKANVIYIDISESFQLDFSSSDLTKFASEMSESSFAELWDGEDDDYWNSYLSR